MSLQRRPARSTDLAGLEALALAQGGYFRREDAIAHGITDRLLSYHKRTGRFDRVLPGVYRLTRAPVSPNDELLLAWVWSRYGGAISHESALALYDLSDLLPSKVQLTVPVDERRRTARFDLHRSQLQPEEIRPYEGVSATVPGRAIVDAAAGDADPEQIQKAIRQALDRALLTPERLRAAAARSRYRNKRAVQRLIEQTLGDVALGARR